MAQIKVVEIAFISVVIMLSGCNSLGKIIKIERESDTSRKTYHLRYNNRSRNQKPAFISVYIDTIYKKTRSYVVYEFSLDSVKVTKYKSNIEGRSNYLLLVHDENNLHQVIKRNKAENEIFKKIVVLTDSLIGMDYKSILNSDGFLLIKRGRYINQF